jgi:hypothetical protein
MPAYDIMQNHMQEQLECFNTNEFLQLEDPENERLRLQVNIINADAKLKKYRALLTLPVYIAAVVLVPWTKWEYFEDHMEEEELLAAKKAVQKLWKDEYSGISVNQELPGLSAPPLVRFSPLSCSKLTNYSLHLKVRS